MNIFDELNNKQNDEYQELATKIADNSTFNIKIIGNHIADLMSYFEGIKYVYVLSRYYAINEKTIDKKCFNVVIKAKDCEPYYYSEPDFTKTNPIIFNITRNGKRRTKKFYSIENGLLTFNINCQNYLYIEEFIQKLINYRINNNTKEVSQETILECQKEILSKYYEEIAANYEKVYNERKEIELAALQRDYEEQQMKLAKIIGSR